MHNLRIVLIGTSHPGNIGAAARAMKTMGLTELYLVEPKHFPHQNAFEMASGALDVLGQAVVVSSLAEAIADCTLVIGTSARERAIPWPMLTPRTCGAMVVKESKLSPVAIVFGREQSGLTNDELHACHYHLHIPSNPLYSSLNLAAAVQIIAYEIRVANESAAVHDPSWDVELATTLEVEAFFKNLEQLLIAKDFLKPSAPRQLMTRLRRLFYRARLDKMEVNILRGILRAVE